MADQRGIRCAVDESNKILRVLDVDFDWGEVGRRFRQLVVNDETMNPAALTTTPKPLVLISKVPMEVLLHILKYLHPEDIVCLGLTCRHLLSFVHHTPWLDDRLQVWPISKSPIRIAGMRNSWNHRMGFVSRVKPLQGEYRICHYCCRWVMTAPTKWMPYRRDGIEVVPLRWYSWPVRTDYWLAKLDCWAGVREGPCAVCSSTECDWKEICPGCCWKLGFAKHRVKPENGARLSLVDQF